MCIIQRVLFIAVWSTAERGAPSVATYSKPSSMVLRKLCVSGFLQHGVYLIHENEMLLRSVVLMLTIPSISFAHTLNEHEQSTTRDARLQKHVHKLCTPN